MEAAMSNTTNIHSQRRKNSVRLNGLRIVAGFEVTLSSARSMSVGAAAR